MEFRIQAWLPMFFEAAMTVNIDRARLIRAARGVDVLAHLPEQVTVNLLQAGELLEFEQGQLLIKQGEPSDCALVLIEGSADVLVESNYGSAPLASLTAPVIVGEIGVYTNVPRTASVRATTSGQVIRLGRDELERVGQENPRFLSAMLSQLGRRFETFNRAIGFYSHALSALERGQFDLKLLDDLR